MTAYLIVRAEVPEADCEAFDRWYETEHLPEANAAFRAEAAFRGWCDKLPSVHVAVYQFSDLNRARAIVASEEIKALIAEFDRVWQGRVNRTREVLEVKQTL
jgi:hypothetical protein